MNFLTLDVSFLYQPGLYKITCTKTNKLYIGETENVLARLVRHSEALEKNRSGCLEMQKEYNMYGKKVFQFEMLTEFCGSEFLDVTFRTQQEQALIINLRLNGTFLYNRPFHLAELKKKEVLIRGQKYNSLSQAAKRLGESRTNISRKCCDPNHFDYAIVTDLKYENQTSQIYSFRPPCPCLIDGITYKSLNQAAKVLKIHRKAVQKRLDHTINFPEEIYLD